ncbi:hypothetical protein BY458DRAFT_542193 [Sporodiniella umbellata]|nr:hypothetical protein BY458DRAFT_542193 [Sporodiniella umbellata]
MKEATVARNDSRRTEYTKYTILQQTMYIRHVYEKNMKNDDAAKLANVNKHTARKLKVEYIANSSTVDFHDERPIVIVEKGVGDLIKNYEGLVIKKSRVTEFIKDKCNLSLKTTWRPVIFVTPSIRATSKTALDTVSSSSIVNISVREPGSLKRRKAAGDTKRKTPGDRLVVPKEPLAYSIVNPLIISCGYTPVHPPPYSPESKPIEEKLKNSEMFTSRMMGACEQVPLQNIQKYTQHPINTFPKWMTKLPI